MTKVATKTAAYKGRQTKKKPARRRRTAADARRVILEATEKRLIAGGPEAIRLQDIAADIGISHPAILHHFVNREGLLEALGKHATLKLQEDFLQILTHRRVGDPIPKRIGRAAQMLEMGFEMLEKRHLARLLAGLILSGRDLRKVSKGLLSEFAQAMHEARVQRRLEDGRTAPSLEDTLFTMNTVGMVLFGDALCGSYMRLMVGLPDDAETVQRFHLWLVNLLDGFQLDSQQDHKGEE